MITAPVLPLLFTRASNEEAISDGYFHEGELRAAPTFLPAH